MKLCESVVFLGKVLEAVSRAQFSCLFVFCISVNSATYIHISRRVSLTGHSTYSESQKYIICVTDVYARVCMF